MAKNSTKDVLLAFRVDTDWLGEMDRWRREKAFREECDISRSEAIRILVSEGVMKP